MTADELKCFLRDVTCARETAKRLRSVFTKDHPWLLTPDKLEILETCAIDIDTLMLRLTVQAAHLLPETPALPNRVANATQQAARLVH